MRKTKVTISLILILVIQNLGYAQVESNTNDILIDPIEFNCISLEPSGKIKSYQNKERYIGRVVIKVSVDTTTLKLTGHEIVFAILTSRENPNDIIEIRLDRKKGNTEYLDKIKPNLVEHLSYLKVKMISGINCLGPMAFAIPIEIK